MGYIFRVLNNSDRDGVLAVFNYYVENGFAAYFTESVGCGFFTKMKELASGYPFYVIETVEHLVVGFGLLHPYHPAKSFQQTAELTYFIVPNHTRMGLGEKLLHLLSHDARELGIRILLASVSSANEQSLSFHRKQGFEECGRFAGVGRKFGQDFDVIWMQKQL